MLYIELTCGMTIEYNFAMNGSFLAILSGLCYGLVGYFGVSFMERDFSVSCMLFWRFFVATLCMGFFIRKNPFTKDALWLFSYGLLFYGPSTTLYFSASEYIGTGLAMVLLFTFPAIVMAINSIYYKAKIRKLYYFAFIMILLGMCFLVNPENMTVGLYGISLGLLSALLYALYIACSKHISVEPKLSTFMVSAGCMATSLVAALYEESLCMPDSSLAWIEITSMGLICTALPILLLLKAMHYISSEKASMLSVLEPVFVVIFGILLLGEQITLLEFLGVSIILSGALLTLMPEPKPEEAKIKEAKF